MEPFVPSKATKCSVIGCDSYSDRGSNVSFHTLPRSPVLREKWTDNLKINMKLKKILVCSKHFQPDDYPFADFPAVRRRLRSTAVPKVSSKKKKVSKIPTFFSLNPVEFLEQNVDEDSSQHTATVFVPGTPSEVSDQVPLRDVSKKRRIQLEKSLVKSIIALVSRVDSDADGESVDKWCRVLGDNLKRIRDRSIRISLQRKVDSMVWTAIDNDLSPL